MVVAVVGGDVSDLGDDVGPEAARQRMAHSRVDGESGAGAARASSFGPGHSAFSEAQPWWPLRWPDVCVDGGGLAAR